MTSTTALAARIAQARMAAGFATPYAAAIRLAMHPATYGSHEAGQAAPKSADLRRYAEAFGVSIGWLTSGIGTGPRKAG